MESSLADTLPTVDFNFNDLRERMAQFTVRFDDFIERGRKRVLEERNAFRMSLADVEGKEWMDLRMSFCQDHSLQ
jgi:kinetochore protein Spc25